MTTKVISTQPATILPLSSVKEWCRIGSGSEDGILQSLIDAVIQQGEDVTWWSLREKQMEITWLEKQEQVKLPGAPIESVDKVEVYDGTSWTEDEDAINVIDMNDWIRVVKRHPLKITYTVGAYDSPMVNMLMKDLVIAKWESRPEDGPQVDYILKRLAKHRNHVTL